jgi:putative RecB family exonuclease
MSAQGEVFSYSRLSTFDSCRTRYKFQYIDRLPQGPTTIEAFMGSRVHEALEEWYGRRGLGEAVGLQELIEAYREAWRRQWRDDVRIVKRGVGVDSYRAQGERCLITYFQTTGRSDSTETLAMEIRVEIPLGGGGAPAMQGYVDRLARSGDGALEIHDYKTTSRMPSEKELEGDPQLRLYQLGVEHMFPKAPAIRLIRHFLNFGQQHRASSSPELLALVQEKMKAKIGEALACTEFPPNVTPLCRWCSYQDRCDAWQGAL